MVRSDVFRPASNGATYVDERAASEFLHREGTQALIGTAVLPVMFAACVIAAGVGAAPNARSSGPMARSRSTWLGRSAKSCGMWLDRTLPDSQTAGTSSRQALWRRVPARTAIGTSGTRTMRLDVRRPRLVRVR